VYYVEVAVNRLLCIVVGMVLWSACAKAEEPISTSGRFFAPVGGLVALNQPESEVIHFIGVALMPDSKIAYDVEVKLLDPSIAAPNVVVSVKDQEVTLTGTVRSGAQADDLERAVRQVAGIVSLNNLVGLR
jgi:hypothetical protein